MPSLSEGSDSFSCRLLRSPPSLFQIAVLALRSEFYVRVKRFLILKRGFTMADYVADGLGRKPLETKQRLNSCESWQVEKRSLVNKFLSRSASCRHFLVYIKMGKGFLVAKKKKSYLRLKRPNDFFSLCHSVIWCKYLHCCKRFLFLV